MGDNPIRALDIHILVELALPALTIDILVVKCESRKHLFKLNWQTLVPYGTEDAAVHLLVYHTFMYVI